MKIVSSVILFFLGTLAGFAQLKPLGSWTDHLPYNRGTSITASDNVIYCGTETGLFSYNTEDNSISKFSKVNRLNDVAVSKIQYAEEYNTLVVVYDNGNIDLLSGNNTVNIPFLKLSNESGDLNEIKIIDNFAYLAFDFGIMVVDIERNEIKDTYKFGQGGNTENVKSTEIIGNQIFAGTENGIYKANLTSNLLDFNSWSKYPLYKNNSIKKLLTINNQLTAVVNFDELDSILILDNGRSEPINKLSNVKYINSSKNLDNSYNIFIESTYIQLSAEGIIEQEISISTTILINGLFKKNRLFTINRNDPLNEINLNDGSISQLIKPKGPSDKSVFDLDASNGVVWSVNGGHDFSFTNRNEIAKLSSLENGEWKSYTTNNNPYLNSTIAYDVVSVNIDPNDPKSVFFGSWAIGLYEFQGGNEFQLYRDTNSSLQMRLAWQGWVGCGETAFDQSGNLWVTNTYTRNCLSVRKVDGSWKTFDFSDYLLSDETAVFDIAISNRGHKWFTLPRDNKILVFDDNGTIDNVNDDRVLELSPGEGNGNIPGSRGIKIEKDRNGLMWIGTTDGIAVHFNPDGVFESGNKDFSRIIAFTGENNEIVLEGATVKDIAVDGANRKWIATDNSGVILLSEDGKESLAEFNESNSPLFSNTIDAITIDDESGEVYIGTSNGLLSYRGSSVTGSENLSELSIFPNPVREDYRGMISINGLMNETTVKITDINGTLINELKSQGGQVLWDGNNFNGRRASTGVYLIFSSAEDDNSSLKTQIGKIMFIK